MYDLKVIFSCIHTTMQQLPPSEYIFSRSRLEVDPEGEGNLYRCRPPLLPCLKPTAMVLFPWFSQASPFAGGAPNHVASSSAGLSAQ